MSEKAAVWTVVILAALITVIALGVPLFNLLKSVAEAVNGKV
jgi:hypothetical protein